MRDNIYAQSLRGQIAANNSLKGIVATVFKVDAEPYTGSYEVTPTAEAQELETKQKYMTDNIIIKPIPKEYGRITYTQDKVIIVT